VVRDGGEKRGSRRQGRGPKAAISPRGNITCARATYYYTGERFVPPGDKKLDIYKKALRCSQEGLKRRHKNIEFVEVPYQGETLPRTS